MAKITLTDDQIMDLIEELVGTWKVGLEVLGDIIGEKVDSWDDVDDDTYEKIFSTIEKCDGCSFWYSTDEGYYIKDKFYCRHCSIEDPTDYEDEFDQTYYEVLISHLSDHVGHNVEIIEDSLGCISLICKDCGDVITDTDTLEEEIGCR